MPADRPNLVALQDQRQQVIALLTERFSEDILDVDEFEQRVDAAHKANSQAELNEVVSDLKAPTGSPSTALVPTRPSAEELAVLETNRPAHKTMLSVFSSAERDGGWRVPRTSKVIVVFGHSLLDFRETTLPPGVTEVRVSAVMGAVEVIVPPNLAVECDGFGIMGSFDTVDRVPAIPDPNAPLLRISGSAFMGSLELHTRLPGETAKDASKRRKREQKAKRKQLTSG